MAKKNLQSIASKLQPVAASLPTQNTAPEPAPTPEKQGSVEPLVQFSFGLRKSQRKELKRLAEDEDLTMRAFILNALKDKGLTVTDDDLLDLRRSG